MRRSRRSELVDATAATAAEVAGVHVRGLGVQVDGVGLLADVDLDVDRGSWTCVVGPNGAGKTTLLRAVAGVVPGDTAGVVHVTGVRTTRLRPRELARLVAVVPQQPVLPAGMTVGAYVLLGRTAHLGLAAGEGPRDRAVAAAQLERLDLTDMADRAIETLSGGEAQRAVLARALAQEAPVLLLDEPTSALDLGHASNVLAHVDRLRRDDGLTVLAAMHDLTLAGQFADRLVLLADGRVVANGEARDVLDPVLLSHHYGTDVRVLDDPATGLVVVPARPGAPVRLSAGPQPHDRNGHPPEAARAVEPPAPA